MIAARLVPHLREKGDTPAKYLREVWPVLPWDQPFQLEAEEARM